MDKSIFKGPSTSTFLFKFPIESTAGKRKVKALCFEPKTSEVNLIFSRLLWHALFGKGSFKVRWWLSLFNVLNEQTSPNKGTVALYAILKLTTAKAGSTFDSNLRCVSNTLVRDKFSSEDLKDKIISKILEDLPLVLPKKNPGEISDLLNCSLGFIEQKRPDSPAFIGVGYKDKGSLGKTGESYDPTEQTYFPHLDYDLWKQILVKYSEYPSSIMKKFGLH